MNKLKIKNIDKRVNCLLNGDIIEIPIIENGIKKTLKLTREEARKLTVDFIKAHN